MKISRLIGPRTSQVAEVDDPVPGDDQVLVEVLACGVCTSDLGPWLSHDAAAPPKRLGHEIVGRVVAAGRDATQWAPGDVVTGLGGDGFATLAVLEADAILPIPPGIEPAHAIGEPVATLEEALSRSIGQAGELSRSTGQARQLSRSGGQQLSRSAGQAGNRAAIFEPAADPEEALSRSTGQARQLSRSGGQHLSRPAGQQLSRSGGQVGDRVAIAGLGFMGLGLVQLARRHAPDLLVGVDPDPARRQRALKLGADHVFAPDELPEQYRTDTGRATEARFDLVLEATGVTAGLTTAGSMVRPFGTLCVVGYHHTGDAMMDMDLWYKGVTIVNGFCPDRRRLMNAMREALDLIALRRFSYAPLVTHRFALDEIDDAFRVMRAAGPDYVKGVLIP